ncbi:hypothetical protein ACE6H2_008550 [Prunus campanulata]
MGSWGPSRGRIVGAPGVHAQNYLQLTQTAKRKPECMNFSLQLIRKGIGCSLLCRLQRGPKRLICLQIQTHSLQFLPSLFSF